MPSPAIPVLYLWCNAELTAIFPTLPGTYALDNVTGFVWADGFITLDLHYVSQGVDAAPRECQIMHAHLAGRFAGTGALEIVSAIELDHHQARYAGLRSSIAALRMRRGSPPWPPAAIAELHASAATLFL